MQIGLPTDVKHVAHIGWDGPGSTNSGSSNNNNAGGAPSWVISHAYMPLQEKKQSLCLLDSSNKMKSWFFF